VLPGTRYASSVAVDSGDGVGSAIYYTLGGDSRVYRADPAGGPPAVVHDFGTAGIARDVEVRSGTLIALVGGNVAFGFDTTLGYVQFDGGGDVYRVDLAAGTTVPVTARGSRARHPALSPSGARVVAELPGGGAGPSLWLFAVP